jgi:hypothetical protein
MSRFKPISKSTAKDLTGHWIGYTEVLDDQEPRKYRSTITMEPRKRTITGKIMVTIESREKDDNKGWTLDYLGGFIRDGFMQLDYWNPNPEISQFGSIIYVSKGPRLFEGLFVAMGRDLGRLIYGKAILQKQ